MVQIRVYVFGVQVALEELEDNNQSQTPKRLVFEAEINPASVVDSIRTKCLDESGIFSQNQHNNAHVVQTTLEDLRDSLRMIVDALEER